MLVLVFDCETGGLNPKKHSVFSIGALVGDLDTGEIIASFEAFNKLASLDDYVYTAKAVEIHGITPYEAFTKGIPTSEIRDKFMDLWQDHGVAILGGHNIEYDCRMVAYQIFNCEPNEFEANFTYRKLDSLPLIRVFTGHDDVPSGATLTQTIKALNINMDEFGKNKFHAALFDSICCFKILHKFRTVLSQPDIVERFTK